MHSRAHHRCQSLLVEVRSLEQVQTISDLLTSECGAAALLPGSGRQARVHVLRLQPAPDRLLPCTLLRTAAHCPRPAVMEGAEGDACI